MTHPIVQIDELEHRVRMRARAGLPVLRLTDEDRAGSRKPTVIGR